MRAVPAIILLLNTALPGLAHSEPPGISPSIDTSVAKDRNQARWADLEAQSRISDGDYDGAVQAEKQAEAARTSANQRELAARAAKRP